MSVKPPSVPFFRPEIGDDAIAAVASSLRSGWLTAGPKVAEFEENFARSVGATHAVAVNSCTAALHLAVEALGLKHGQGVLVPTMTFAATAEVVRYQGAIPILVDCDPVTANMDLNDAARKIDLLRLGKLPACIDKNLEIAGIMPVHVAGMLMDTRAVKDYADERGLWIVEDAAHAFPAAFSENESGSWRSCGEGTADVTCFSFYANKTITTGEGGMAVTDSSKLAARMRLMSNHGLSNGTWERGLHGRSWEYEIIAPGFKYNLADAAAALGIHQLANAESMRIKRESIAEFYLTELADLDAIELPHIDREGRLHAWHLFIVRLELDKLSIDRDAFIDLLRKMGVGTSVHWRPLHLHRYYKETFAWPDEMFPAAASLWKRVVSLPIFSDLGRPEAEYVVGAVKEICSRYAR